MNAFHGQNYNQKIKAEVPKSSHGTQSKAIIGDQNSHSSKHDININLILGCSKSLSDGRPNKRTKLSNLSYHPIHYSSDSESDDSVVKKFQIIQLKVLIN